MPIILAIQEAEIRMIEVWSQPKQIVCETLFWKKKKSNPSQKRAGGVAQGEGPEFKPQILKKKMDINPQKCNHLIKDWVFPDTNLFY
jgi:hypothetical protein